MFHLIAGQYKKSGYQDGVGSDARFGNISGIVSSPDGASKLWVADHSNSCIRLVDMLHYDVSTFAGHCTRQGDRDGHVRVALLMSPISIIEWPRNSTTIFFYDNGSRNLRFLQKYGGLWRVFTRVRWNKKIQSMTFDTAGDYLYFVFDEGIGKLSFLSTAKVIEEIFLTTSGFSDGRIDIDGSNVAKVKQMQDAIPLNDDLFLIADYANSNLRLFDLKNSLTSTICIPQVDAVRKATQDVSSCKINKPTKFFKRKSDNSKVYILGKQAIYILLFVGEYINVLFSICSNLTVVLNLLPNVNKCTQTLTSIVKC